VKVTGISGRSKPSWSATKPLQFHRQSVARTGAEWALGDAPPAGLEVVRILFEGARMGQKPIPDARGHRAPQVRVADQGQCAVRPGSMAKGPSQALEHQTSAVDGGAHPQPQIESDLLVAAAGRVHALARVADGLDQSPLERRVHVLVPGLDGPLAGPEGVAQPLQSGLNRRVIGVAEQAGFQETRRVGHRAGDVVLDQTLVHGPVVPDRETQHVGVDRLPVSPDRLCEAFVHERTSLMFRASSASRAKRR
jgi:hypothetical protein